MASKEEDMEKQLPPLPSDGADMRGPTPTSNWVIPGKLIAGAYPGNPHPEKHRETIRAVIQSGVTLFLCLMEHEERKVLKFVAYEDVAQKISAEYGRDVQFEYFPMPDMYVPEDNQLVTFIPKLAHMVQEPGQCVYVHCWGGHGRTGIIIATLLTVLYGINADQALHLTEAYHSKREEARSHSPQNTIQINQVKRVSPLIKQ